MKHLFYSLILFFAFTSCDKGELPKPKMIDAGAETIQVSMGGNYENQVFYNLESREIIAQNNREIWDLAFESSADGFYIRLNDSKLMAAKPSGQTEFSAVTSTQNTNWKWDRPSGNLDSTAIGDWRNSDEVFIIDRGMNISGSALGRFKLKPISVSETNYEIEFGPLNSTTPFVFSIPKNQETTWTYFSFNNSGEIKSIAPKKNKWDLCFTSYTHVFDAHTPYLVTGVLLNPHAVSAQVHAYTFESVSFATTLTKPFSEQLNIIGYDWKTFDFDLSIYTIDTARTFVVKTTSGKLIKLKFIDFYDQNGVKGTPTLEIEELIP